MLKSQLLHPEILSAIEEGTDRLVPLNAIKDELLVATNGRLEVQARRLDDVG